MDFCKQENARRGLKVVVVYPGGQDDYTLLNAFATAKKDLLFVICGSVDFQVILTDDTNLQ
jgi:hypothetical protein